MTYFYLKFDRPWPIACYHRMIHPRKRRVWFFLLTTLRAISSTNQNDISLLQALPGMHYTCSYICQFLPFISYYRCSSSYCRATTQFHIRKLRNWKFSWSKFFRLKIQIKSLLAMAQNSSMNIHWQKTQIFVDGAAKWCHFSDHFCGLCFFFAYLSEKFDLRSFEIRASEILVLLFRW